MELSDRVGLLERETAALKQHARVQERRAKGWRLATGVLVVAGLVLCSPAARPLLAQGNARQPAQKEILTQKLIVVDKQGNPRITLAVDDANDATLGLLDGKGKVRVSMGTDGTSTSLSVGDSQGHQRLGMVVIPDGTSLLMAFDPKAKPRAAFGLNDDAKPVLATFDADGKQTDIIK